VTTDHCNHTRADFIDNEVVVRLLEQATLSVKRNDTERSRLSSRSGGSGWDGRSVSGRETSHARKTHTRGDAWSGTDFLVEVLALLETSVTEVVTRSNGLTTELAL
jgi:hypothetical protein